MKPTTTNRRRHALLREVAGAILFAVCFYLLAVLMFAAF